MILNFILNEFLIIDGVKMNLRRCSTYRQCELFKLINDIFYENKVKNCLKKTSMVWNYFYNCENDFNKQDIQDICMMV